MTHKQTEQWQAAQKEITHYNRPCKPIVAINCIHIGDDNDYSCFLSGAVFIIWKAGEKSKAMQLANTDPMLTAPFTEETFESYMQDHVKFLKEQEETAAAYYKNYRD